MNDTLAAPAPQHVILLVDANYLTALELKKSIEAESLGTQMPGERILVQITGAPFEAADALSEANFNLSIVDADSFSFADDGLLARLLNLPAGAIIIGSEPAISALNLPMHSAPSFPRPYRQEQIVAAVMARLAGLRSPGPA